MSDISGSIKVLEQQLTALKQQAYAPVPVAVDVGVPGNTEPGYTTTEFWATVAVNLTAFIAIFHPGFHAPDQLVQAATATASGLATLAYSFARTFRKNRRP